MCPHTRERAPRGIARHRILGTTSSAFRALCAGERIAELFSEFGIVDGATEMGCGGAGNRGDSCHRAWWDLVEVVAYDQPAVAVVGDAAEQLSDESGQARRRHRLGQ